jgi:ABC-type phosphate/phosphonate transport system ATPase subunit
MGTTRKQGLKKSGPPANSWASFEGNNAASVLAFENITWTADLGKKGTKQILKGVSGVVQGGSVMAIMGPSGAGKTSLLQILSGQKLQTSGTVELNGETLGAATKRHIGMVPQEDVLLPSITVQEALAFSAALRIPVSAMLFVLPSTSRIIFCCTRLKWIDFSAGLGAGSREEALRRRSPQ